MTEHYSDSGPGNHDANIAGVIADVRRQEAMLKIGALMSATDATQGILTRAHLPEIILMDINLPGGISSGIKALSTLREDSLTTHIPVIAISANAMPRDIKKGLEAGFSQYLTKPIRVKEFMNALNVALEFSEALAVTPAQDGGM